LRRLDWLNLPYLARQGQRQQLPFVWWCNRCWAVGHCMRLGNRWIVAFVGVIARRASSVQGTSLIILFPLTFLSNASAPFKTPPSWLRAFVNLNPLSHLISVARDLANRGTINHSFWVSLLDAAIIVGVFTPATVRTYYVRVKSSYTSRTTSLGSVCSGSCLSFCFRG
jgi:ABC-type multidrug transport system permease subunit